MKKIFVSYFDLLGYKNFILNSSNEIIKRYVDAIFLQVELAISDGETTTSPRGRVVANMEESSINCLNISDTIIFSTNDNSLESFNEILRVSDNLNWRLNDFLFPARGCLVYGDMNLVSFDKPTKNGGSYRLNSLSGRGLVKAHTNAESQVWAGCVIDKSVVDYVNSIDDFNILAGDKVIKFNIPYKRSNILTECVEEYVFKLVKNLNNDLALNNYKNGIIEVFEKFQNGRPLSKSQNEKLENTLRFLDFLMHK